MIAQQPVEPRDASRLMVVRRDTGEIEHRIFRDLAEYLNAGDALVVNRTRVLPAKFLARRATGGRVEGLFIREIEIGIWEVMLGGLRRLKTGEVLQVDPRGRGSAGSGVEAVRM
ncbi:MAG TPA: S-adenosylmethionine:tRNA ribosyltransferase-isomerase, partial [Phycisphaerae bacterium]|nr:S-adenosylmethionine:tRNA ribosyltransferase-isomerase [Phycisphaerae bacterium]